jgi:ABC-type dipeptide/oligopeptide/nickel transport system permease subunit
MQSGRAANMRINQIFENIFSEHIIRQKDKFWSLLFLSGILVLFIWDLFFLNTPALLLLIKSFLNTFIIGLFSVAITFLIAWRVVLLKNLLNRKSLEKADYFLELSLDFLDSIPQIIWLLLGYLYAIKVAEFEGIWLIFFLILIISLAFLHEVVQEMESRIDYFKKSDFYNAMLVLGIEEKRIINNEILLGNSLAHLINKGVNIFASVIFLICSVDFIISVGLTSSLSLSNLPATLGSLLSNLDSKQDILAIGNLFNDPFYFTELLTKHLQGISTALVLIFTLISAYKISNGLIERKKLD